MMVYGSTEDVEKKCPACGAEPNVFCGVGDGGGLVHERRIAK